MSGLKVILMQEECKSPLLIPAECYQWLFQSTVESLHKPISLSEWVSRDTSGAEWNSLWMSVLFFFLFCYWLSRKNCTDVYYLILFELSVFRIFSALKGEKSRMPKFFLWLCLSMTHWKADCVCHQGFTRMKHVVVFGGLFSGIGHDMHSAHPTRFCSDSHNRGSRIQSWGLPVTWRVLPWILCFCSCWDGPE